MALWVGIELLPERAIPRIDTRRTPPWFLSFLRRGHFWGYNGQISTVSVPET
jgi:hypothetical protein